MTFSDRINHLFEHEQWSEARRLLEERLRTDPENHWLLTRLGTTYYEQADYAKALELSKKASELAPTCLLTLWDLASTQEMLGNDVEAARVYGEVFRLVGAGRAEQDHCEGTEWVHSLLADCFYSAAGCTFRLGHRDKAAWFMQQHFKYRALGVKSIYSLKSARERLREIVNSEPDQFLKEGLDQAGAILAGMS